MARQSTLETGEAHERHRHLRRLRRIWCRSNLMDSAGRKTEGEPSPKAHNFLRRAGTMAYRLALRIEALEQAHSLKEVKPIALREAELRHRGFFPPVLVSHGPPRSSIAGFVPPLWEASASKAPHVVGSSQ